MIQNRRAEEVLINDAIECGLIKSIEDIPTFVFAHYRGEEALIEYYNCVPKSMISIVFRQPKETSTCVMQKLKDAQFDGMSLDQIISNETSVLREQLQLLTQIINYNSKAIVLTKNNLYSLPVHSTEDIDLNDQGYLEIRNLVAETMEKKPDQFRSRAGIEAFVSDNEHIPKLNRSDPLRVDKLISYLRMTYTL